MTKSTFQLEIHFLNELFQTSNYSILSVNTDPKQLYFQLQMLLTDQRLHHVNNLYTLIHKHLYGKLQKKIIYPFIKTFILIYLRFIDDIFVIWTGSKTDLEKCLNKLKGL